MRDRTLLVIEDSPFLRLAATRIFERRGYRVLGAADGEEGLALARLYQPDVVLLDLILPRLDGAQVFHALQTDPTTAAIPVVVLSNLGQESSLAAPVLRGVAHYVVKANTSLTTLADMVDRLLVAGPRPAPGGAA